MSNLTEEQERIARNVKTQARETGHDPKDLLHEVSGRTADKAAVARELCPEAVGEWSGSIEQRMAGRDAYAERVHARMDDKVLALDAGLDPADHSLEAEQIRETAASVRDHREMDARREQWAAQDKQQAAQQPTAATATATATASTEADAPAVAATTDSNTDADEF